MFDEISKAFGVKESDVIFYTWGDTIHAPCKKMPPDYLIVHEEQHQEQQGDDPEEWWCRYLLDADFRADQEAEAYGAQLRWMRRQKRWKDRNAAARALHEIAVNLSAIMYGKCLTYREAVDLVKAYADGTAIADIETKMPDTGEPNS